MEENEKQWYICPVCGYKLLKTKKGFYSRGVFIKCKKCQKEIEIKSEQ